MKKNIILLLVFGIAKLVYSQEILVPFRIGNLWGLSDTLGHIRLQPAYDDILFRLEDRGAKDVAPPQGFYLTKKNGKYGILRKDAELIKPVYDKIYCSGEAYFIVYTGASIAHMTLDGKPVFPPGYWSDTKLLSFTDPADSTDAKSILFKCEDRNQKKSLFCYHSKDPEKSKLLLDGYDSLEEIPVYWKDRLLLKVRKEKEGPVKYIHIAYDHQNKSFFVKKTGTDKKASEDENDLMEPMDIMSPMGEVAESESALLKHPTISDMAIFKIIEGKLYMEITVSYNANDRTQNGKKYTREIAIPADAKNIKIEIYNYLHHRIRLGDTSRNFRNYVTYRQKGKHGFICSPKVIPATFDSLALINVRSENEEERIRFIFGKKDSLTGIMELGQIDTRGNIIFPPLYHTISCMSEHFSSSYRIASDKWTVSRNGKSGVITPENKIILEIKYDTIIERGEMYTTPRYKLLRKDGLYGVYYKENDGLYTSRIPAILLEPFTRFSIEELVFLPRTKEKHRNYFTLMRVVDEKGEKKGYIGKSGLIYFKEE